MQANDRLLLGSQTGRALFILTLKCLTRLGMFTLEDCDNDCGFAYVIVMPCPFTGRKMFCAGPNFLSQPKNLTAFSASSKTFVAAQKPILLNANHLFVWHKMFATATICK